MDIYIKSSAIQFKNPITGQPTLAVAEHYNGRRITASVDGEDQMFRFTKDQMPFNVTEYEMIDVIKVQIATHSSENA